MNGPEAPASRASAQNASGPRAMTGRQYDSRTTGARSRCDTPCSILSTPSNVVPPFSAREDADRMMGPSAAGSCTAGHVFPFEIFSAHCMVCDVLTPLLQDQLQLQLQLQQCFRSLSRARLAR